MRSMDPSDQNREIQFKASVVHLILNGNVEEALTTLADHYHVSLPRLKVGLPSRNRKKVVGCYTAKTQTIYLANSETLQNPFVVLHEFYHHLRTSIDKKHRGTEKYASDFARDFIDAYQTLTRSRCNP